MLINVNKVDKDEYMEKALKIKKRPRKINKDKDKDKDKENKKTTNSEYSILYVSGSDFGIQKITSKTNQILHLIHSKKRIILENVKSHTYEELSIIINDHLYYNDETIKKIKSFFSGLDFSDIIFPKNLIPFFKEDYFKGDICLFLNHFFNNNYISYLYSKNIPFNKNINTSIDYSLVSLYNYDVKIFEIFLKKMNNKLNILKISNDVIGFLIKNNVKIDDFNYIVDILYNYQKSPIEYRDVDISKYNISLKQFFKYLFIEQNPYMLFARTTFYSNHILYYLDYLEISFNLYGKVKNKYPKYLITEHNKISRKYREKTNFCNYKNKFNEAIENANYLNYNSSIEKYEIIVPSKYTDLIEEGENLNHCVASYIPKMANNDCYVVFLRDKNKRDKSLLTIEVLLNNDIIQVEGLNMRRTLSNEENHFINNWAKKKNLNIKATNVVIE